MAELFANSGDPDQTPRSAALIWVCTVCQLPFWRGLGGSGGGGGAGEGNNNYCCHKKKKCAS